MIKNGKKLKLNPHQNYSVSIGTIDNKNPKAMYLTISAWGCPIDSDCDNYESVIKSLNKDIKSKLYQILDNRLFNINKTIVDLDMRHSGITLNKKSFMSCDVTLFKLNDFKINDNIIKTSVTKVINELIYEVFEKSDYFKFTKTKK